MTDVAVAYTAVAEAEAAGRALGTQILAGLNNEPPDALVLFASSQYDYERLLRAVTAACRPAFLVGCSSAGEFTDRAHGSGAASAFALRSSEMRFAASIGRGLRADRAAATQGLVDSFVGRTDPTYRYRSALILTDALAGHAEDLVERLTVLTAGSYRLFGGGAGDDARFQHTDVFYGTEAISDAVVALEILSNKPVGIGVSHGWRPSGPAMRVTEAEAAQLISLNAAPAAEVFEEHAQAKGQAFDREEPLPFFLHNVVGVVTESGYQLRVPLAVAPDGAIVCAAEIPTGSTAHIMEATSHSAAEAAARAAASALEQLEGHRPKAALFFDCAATRLRLGQAFGGELAALEHALGPIRFAGCNTYGQIARADGQFSGFHNCTAVVCVFPE